MTNPMNGRFDPECGTYLQQAEISMLYYHQRMAGDKSSYHH